MTEFFASYREMSDEAERYISEIKTWMEDHGSAAKKPWPAHIIASKSKRLEWATKAKEIFDRGSKRDGEAA